MNAIVVQWKGCTAGARGTEYAGSELALGAVSIIALIGNHTAALLAPLAASTTRPFRLVAGRPPTARRTRGGGGGLGGSQWRRIAQVPCSGKRRKVDHRDPVHLH